MAKKCHVGSAASPRWRVPVVWVRQEIVSEAADSNGMVDPKIRTGKIKYPYDLRGLVLLHQAGMASSMASYALMQGVLSSRFFRRLMVSYQQMLDSGGEAKWIIPWCLAEVPSLMN